MAPKKAASKAAKPAAKDDETKSGRAVILSNGEKRVDYIRRRYYKDDIKRGAIRKELADKFKHEVAYQIVFAATKEKEMPVPKSKAEKEDDPKKDTIG